MKLAKHRHDVNVLENVLAENLVEALVLEREREITVEVANDVDPG
jgi:hypothetical protein